MVYNKDKMTRKSQCKNCRGETEEEGMKSVWNKRNESRGWQSYMMWAVVSLLMLLAVHVPVCAKEGRAYFTSEYATPGKILEVQLEGVDLEGSACTYEWTVGQEKREADGNLYQVTERDLEQFIQVTVRVTGAKEEVYTASMYCSRLPVMYITTEAQIQNKEDYVDGTMTVQRSDSCRDATVYDGDIEIRYRGNTTMGYPKKPYKVKLGEKTDMFGFGKNKHWTLLANYLDGSFMRNSLSYNLSGALGMPYMQSVNVILILNGQYQGLYQFCEQIRVDYDSDGNRVDIYDWESAAEDNADVIAEANGFSKDEKKELEEAMLEDLSWAETKSFSYGGATYQLSDYEEIEIPPLTGGYLIELDSYYDELSKFTTAQLGQPINIKSPETAYSSQALMDFARTYLDAVETAVQSYNFTGNLQKEKLSYSQLVDLGSLVDYFLVNELFMNEDAMKKSTYMYKDIEGPLFMGPIWDMDWSSDSGVGSSNRTDQWQTLYFNDGAQSRQWYKFLLRDPYFAQKVRERYWEIRDTLLEEIIQDGGVIDARAGELKEAAAADFSYWNLFGGDYSGQVQRLKRFLTERIAWLDQQFASMEALQKSWGVEEWRKTEASCQLTDQGKTKVSVAVPQGTVRASLLVNGAYMGETSVTGDQAVLWVDQEKLTELGRGEKRMAVYCFEYEDGSSSCGYGELDPDVLPAFRTIRVRAGEHGTAGLVEEEEWLKQVFAFDQEKLVAKAEARQGYRFAGWYANGVLVSKEQQYTFTVDGDLTLEARFEQEPDVFCIRVSAGQGGTAGILTGNGTAPSVTAEADSKITIVASASLGYIFDGWYEGDRKAYEQEQVELTVKGELSLQARFVMKPAQGEVQEPEDEMPDQTREPQDQRPRSLKQVKIRAIPDQVYNGKAKKPKLHLTYEGDALKLGADYTVVYKKNKNTGKAKAILTGKGSYQGTRTVFFRIVPKKASIVKVACLGKRAARITWKRDRKATGYQIQYCTKKSFRKDIRKVTVQKNRITSKKLSRLGKGRDSYVRIRSYRIIGGKKAYGPYSKIKKISLKKAS